jgi:bacterioferritin
LREPTAANRGQLTDSATLRRRAREGIESGAATAGYGANRETVLRLLNEDLAGIVCTLRYRRHYFTANGFEAHSVRQEFLEHAQEQLADADKLAVRSVPPGGEADFNPQTLTERSHAKYIAGDSLEAMIRADLVAERIAIDSYREMIAYLAPHDPTLRGLRQEIVAHEEEHAEDLASMLLHMHASGGGS